MSISLEPCKLAGSSPDRLITAETVVAGYFILVLSKHSPSLSSVSQSTALSSRSLCNNVVEDMLLAGKESVVRKFTEKLSNARTRSITSACFGTVVCFNEARTPHYFSSGW